MPRIAIDYSTREVSFYRFVCNDPEIKSSYVGHTVNFIERKHNHKVSCNNPNGNTYNLKIYQIIRDNGGFDNWRMIEIESRIVKDKREAERIEQKLIEKLEADMNSIKAFVLAETKNEYFKLYRQENKEYITIRESKKRQIKITCECGSVISCRELTQHKRTKKHIQLMETKNAVNALEK